MRDILNCPNCGAPIVGDRCLYCGTVFYDFAAIDMDKPSYIKMRLNGHVVIFKGILRNVDIEMASYQLPSITAEFTVIQDKGVTYTVVKE